MSSRVNHFKTIPALAKTLADASMALGKVSLDKKLKHLVDIRASQMNHCAFCLDMHVKEAKCMGSVNCVFITLQSGGNRHCSAPKRKLLWH